YSCRSLRHLPSFPTRRSSDLLVNGALSPILGGKSGLDGAVGGALQIPYEFLFVHGQNLLVPDHNCAVNDDRVHRAARGGKHKALDRKSTRLHSSHVKISYAVF